MSQIHAWARQKYMFSWQILKLTSLLHIYTPLIIKRQQFALKASLMIKHYWLQNKSKSFLNAVNTCS